ncbi:hypothetical protein [Nitrospina watsonii]|uniref:Uncharacterized protein n=1 Tax=Nitrospina watsonii TaxID=1323948 RepID=A0ABM9HFC3_9BACT|nr:hypothetical protein [Nitrospina watsonii]CAI2718860.1 conserved protein of unknown function [Nitrospina watsonii]
MFVFDPITQGLELLAKRDLQRAEALFLRVINDPYVQDEELQQARTYLSDIRSCQAGSKKLDFDRYKKLSKKTLLSLDKIYELLAGVYFSEARTYEEIDAEIAKRTPQVINRLKQVKVSDIIARDKLFQQIEKQGTQAVRRQLSDVKENGRKPEQVDPFRWKTIFRKFIEVVNPILLERHLELLEYILDTGEIELLDDPKLTVLTPKYRWIIESTIKTKWYLLRSYFFKARSEIEHQFHKKEGTRKYWEEVKYKKIGIFEACGFHERHIQKFLYIDKLNYKTLEEIHQFAQSLDLTLVPRDVSLALRGVDKAKDHIKERGGYLMGARREFQDQLIDLGFSKKNAYQIARQAKKANNHQIVESYKLALQVARDEIYWYRVPPHSEPFQIDIQGQCVKHLSTVRIHLFDRGRLNKLLLKTGKSLIRRYLVQVYGDEVVDLHCYFRLETIHQYYKLKFFQYHQDGYPSVSELIKISRKEFKPILVDGFNAFIKKRRLAIPDSLIREMEQHRSTTEWEDPQTTVEEKILLRFWFLMDHGVTITQGLLNKGVMEPGADLLAYLNLQDSECKI